MIEEVRKKWAEHPELKQSHHFVYDFLLRDGNPNVLVLGINPGETSEDWQQFPKGQYEESRHLNFREKLPLSASSKKWFTFIENALPANVGVILSELFFWSSNKAADLKTRYGDWQNSELIEFCTEANQYLIKTHKVSLVLFFGLTFSKLVVRLYDLKLKEVIYSTTDQKKLCEVYLDNEERYWVVCSHPAAHGMTREKKKQISSILISLCPTTSKASL